MDRFSSIALTIDMNHVVKVKKKLKPLVCYLDHQLALVEPGLELFDHFGSELKPGPKVIVHGRGWGTDYLEVRVALEQDFCRASIIFKVHLIVSRGRAQSKRGRNGVIFYENRLLLLLGIRIHGF
ncbi:hypothetical protein Vadar_024135 [Vaccinium darrowii]|uniref:Uncharacterized protein n=1 Tax=Vaccinium darrowii TaxID=229202 RepID=A0ACB7Y249_9ERIC|nr:hypothetical protein Vadar_024135 [Vaccinium darrowii]